MLRYALLAVAAAVAIAVAFVMLPTGGGQRPEPRILSSGDTTSSTGFVIHPADPATPATAPPAAASSPGDLDAVMQRLRAAAAKPDASVAAPAAPVPPPAVTPAPVVPPTTSAAAVPATPAAPATPVAPVPDPAASAPRWASVTAQGTRWRMARSDNGYTVSIDLGGGQVAVVHVQPAFGGLDPASVNVRVDYLRDTIVQNFSRQSGSYSFARDGSVSIDR